MYFHIFSVHLSKNKKEGYRNKINGLTEMWHNTKAWTIHEWSKCSRFRTIAFITIIVLAVTSFYVVNVNIFLPIYSTIVGFDNNIRKVDVEKEFQNQWLRMQKARVDWKSLLTPCAHVNSVKNKSLIGYGKINETSIEESFVEYMNIRPAGQFSQVFIRTRTKDGRNKTIGGDCWMVSQYFTLLNTVVLQY